jgi:hypothetical protein
MALFSTENRLLFAKCIFCFTLLVAGFLLFFNIIFPFISNKPQLIGENLYYFYHNALLVIFIILPLFVYQKLRSTEDDDWRKSAEVLIPVCILGLLFLLIAGTPGLLKSGAGLPASSATTPLPTPPSGDTGMVNVSALQARYGMYGSCADVSRTALEITHNDEIYECSDTAKSLQLDNTNCYFNGIYIDKVVLRDFALLSGEICKREAAKTTSSASDNAQYCRDRYPGSTYDPSVNKCVLPVQGT